jgi:hypothetical protein
MINENETIWFVHLGYAPPLPLRFQRMANLGAAVTGGKNGSHETGHGETYWDKFVEVIRQGYIPVSVAREIGKIDKKWTEPDASKLDEMVASGIYKLATL